MTTLTVEITLAVDVEFDHQPYEPPDRGPEARYPGCAEAITVERVFLGDMEITKALDDQNLDDIEAALWDYRKEGL